FQIGDDRLGDDELSQLHPLPFQAVRDFSICDLQWLVRSDAQAIASAARARQILLFHSQIANRKSQIGRGHPTPPPAASVFTSRLSTPATCLRLRRRSL